MANENRIIDYRAIFERAEHPHRVDESPTIPLKRFIRDALRGEEETDFIKAVVEFSVAGFYIERGTTDPSTRMSHAIREAIKFGLDADQITRASIVAVDLWGNYKQAMGMTALPTWSFRPMTSRQVINFVDEFEREKASKERDRRDRGLLLILEKV